MALLRGGACLCRRVTSVFLNSREGPSRERIEIQGMGGGGSGNLIRFETLSESELDRDPVLGRMTERVRGHGGGAAAGSCVSSAPSDDCAAAAASAAGV